MPVTNTGKIKVTNTMVLYRVNEDDGDCFDIECITLLFWQYGNLYNVYSLWRHTKFNWKYRIPQSQLGYRKGVSL